MSAMFPRCRDTRCRALVVECFDCRSGKCVRINVFVRKVVRGAGEALEVEVAHRWYRVADQSSEHLTLSTGWLSWLLAEGEWKEKGREVAWDLSSCCPFIVLLRVTKSNSKVKLPGRYRAKCKL
jgi:hypothetical protein